MKGFLQRFTSKSIHIQYGSLITYKLYRLLSATSPAESPVELLQAAARDHIPIEPRRQILAKDREKFSMIDSIPDLDSRPSIEEVLREITGRQSDDYEKDDLNELIGMSWYHGQITYRRTFEALPARLGLSLLKMFICPLIYFRRDFGYATLFDNRGCFAGNS